MLLNEDGTIFSILNRHGRTVRVVAMNGWLPFALTVIPTRLSLPERPEGFVLRDFLKRAAEEWVVTRTSMHLLKKKSVFSLVDSLETYFELASMHVKSSSLHVPLLEVSVYSFPHILKEKLNKSENPNRMVLPWRPLYRELLLNKVMLKPKEFSKIKAAFRMKIPGKEVVARTGLKIQRINYICRNLTRLAYGSRLSYTDCIRILNRQKVFIRGKSKNAAA